MSLCLVADIGGTNGRFALFDEEGFREYKSFLCADFKTFEELLSHYIQQLNKPIPKQAVIAIATHVSSDDIAFTNLSWSFKVSEIAHHYDFHYLKVFNDFTAVSISVPLLKDEQLIQIGGKESQEISAKAVLGAGTGLGVSGLLPYNDTWVPIQGQGGHVAYGPYDDFEQALFNYIRREQAYVSAENLLGGKGLELLHRAVSSVNGVTPNENRAMDIVKTGCQDNSSNCAHTLKVFSGILGSVAGDLVLTLGARSGVYIGGGIVNHMIEFFINNETFRSRFEQKGRMSSYIKEVPAYVISDRQVGLLGALESRKPCYKSIGITCSLNE